MSQQEHTAIQQVEFRFREKDGYKRPNVVVEVPMLTPAGVLAAFAVDADGQYQDAKVVELITDVVNDQFVQYIRGAVNSNEEFDQDAMNAMVEKGEITLTHLANLPKSERNVVTNAHLAAFAQAFVQVATEVENTDRRISSVAGANVAAQAFIDRVRSAAGKNEILDKLNDMLEKFVAAASEEVLREHMATVEWLFTKLSEARKVEELSLDNLD